MYRRQSKSKQVATDLENLDRNNTGAMLYIEVFVKKKIQIDKYIQSIESKQHKPLATFCKDVSAGWKNTLAMLILEAFVTLHARHTLRKCATVCVLHPSAPPMKEVCHRSVTVAFAICQVCHQCAGSVVTTLWCRGGERGEESLPLVISLS